MATDISSLRNKQNNAKQEVATANIPANQKLTASEFNKLVGAVQENQQQIADLQGQIVVLTEAEYNALEVKDDKVLYFIAKE